MKTYFITYDYDQTYTTQANNKEEALLNFYEYIGDGYLKGTELKFLSSNITFTRLLSLVNSQTGATINEMVEAEKTSTIVKEGNVL